MFSFLILIWIDSLGVGPVLVSMARQRSQFLTATLNAADIALLNTFSTQLHPLEMYIVNNIPFSNLSIALHWLSLNSEYQTVVSDAANSTKQEIYIYLDEQAAQNRQSFIGVMIACVVTVLGCPAVLFWYALKSDRLMQKVGKYNKEMKKKVKNANIKKTLKYNSTLPKYFILLFILPTQLCLFKKNNHCLEYFSLSSYLCVNVGKWSCKQLKQTINFLQRLWQRKLHQINCLRVERWAIDISHNSWTESAALVVAKLKLQSSTFQYRP